MLSLLLLITGCTTKDNSDTSLLKEGDLITLFKQNNIKVKVIEPEFREELEYKGNRPTVVQLEDTSFMLVIYTFESFEERRIAFREEFSSNEFNKKLKEQNLDINSSFNGAKNTLHFLVSDKQIKNDDDKMKKAFTAFQKILDVVSNDIMKSKVYVYTGEGEYWEGSINVRYNENWLMNDEGTTVDYDSLHDQSGEINYKGREAIGTVEYSYEYITFMGSGKMDSFQQNEAIHINAGSTSGGKPGDHGFYRVTIKWDAMEETITFMAQR